VRELELKVSTQQKLIEILKSLPGRMESTATGENRINGKNTTRKSSLQCRGKKHSRSESADSPQGESKDSSPIVKGIDSDATQLEKASVGAEAPA
jgi:hypothetical protein